MNVQMRTLHLVCGSPALAESQCNLSRTRAVWNLTGWTGFDSNHHRVSWASCRWKALHASYSDSYSPGTVVWRSYHPAPENHIKHHNTVQNLYRTFGIFERHNMINTWTSNVKYFLRFLMIITRKGSLMPRVFFGSAGHVM